MKKTYKIYVIRCPRCNEWKTTYTQNINKYTLKCPKCKKNTKVKDKRKGGYRTTVKPLNTDKMMTAGKVCQALNKRTSPKIQKVIKAEMKKRPSQRRDIERLIQDIEPETSFKEYKK